MLRRLGREMVPGQNAVLCRKHDEDCRLSGRRRTASDDSRQWIRQTEIAETAACDGHRKPNEPPVAMADSVCVLCDRDGVAAHFPTFGADDRPATHCGRQRVEPLRLAVSGGEVPLAAKAAH